MPRKTVTFEDVECIKETDKALLCIINDEEHWIPLSQIDEGSEVLAEEDFGELVITEWIAEEKGLI